jgi:hypothetical protein
MMLCLDLRHIINELQALGGKKPTVTNPWLAEYQAVLSI